MSEEERRRQACIRFVFVLALAFAFSISVLCYLTVNNLINWSDSKVIFITIPLLVGTSIGIILGFLRKPKIVYLEKGEKINRLDILVVLLLGVVLSAILNSLMSFLFFSLSFLIFFELFMGFRYFSNKH